MESEATKRVRVAAYPYYDGREIHPVGTVLNVPASFGMRKVYGPDGKPLLDRKGEPKWVPSDNFPVVEVGDMPPSTAESPAFPKTGAMDPALKGLGSLVSEAQISEEDRKRRSELDAGRTQPLAPQPPSTSPPSPRSTTGAATGSDQ